MKVNNIQNYSANYNCGKKTNCPQRNNPSFKGDFAINFWDAVARGGFAASFTVQDMTGTNFPRTYQALQRNKEITGENNYKAAAEVAIREFITGPSMCIIPMIVLGIAKKASGTTNEVPLENISPFCDEMKSILQKATQERTDLEYLKNYPDQYTGRVKKEFYERMFALALGEDISGGKKVSQTAEELAQMLGEYDAAPKRNFFKQLLNIDLKETVEDGAKRTKGSHIDSKDQIFNRIVTKFTDARKALTDDYSDLMTTDMHGLLPQRKKISSLIKDFSNFGNDVQKTMQKNASPNGSSIISGINFESFMDEFKVRRTGSKFITNALMVIATAAFMFNIPKLYKLYKTNPETDAFRNNEGEVVRANK